MASPPTRRERLSRSDEGRSEGLSGTPKQTLYIEVRINKTGDEFIRMNQIADDVRLWLNTEPVVMRMNQEFTPDTDNLPDAYGARVESVKLVDAKNFDKDTVLFPLPRDLPGDISMPIMIYQLYPIDAITSLGVDEYIADMGDGTGTQELPDARVYPLPNTSFHGLWESLEFEEQLPRKLLRTIVRMEDVSSKLTNTWAVNWNRLVLLYGPPGTGKTSLCRAIAQKLAIRYCATHQVKLVEMNAHSLASKYFSESGKLVQKMFGAIEALLQEDKDRFVIVLVDEIETLTCKRENSLVGREPVDGLRAVNALLTGLDRIRMYKNVIILCTTNLISALDSAFMDRVDVKQEVPLPSKKVIYEILRSGYNALQENQILNPFHMARSRLPEDLSAPVFDDKLPSYGEVGMRFWNRESLPMRLIGIAEKAVGLSGRTLRRLPALSLVYSDEDDVVSLTQALKALEKAVIAELTTRTRAGELHETSEKGGVILT